jgi:hypothetical protein
LQNLSQLPDLIILSEIWINSNEASLYEIPNYKMHVKCSDDYRAGGIAVYLKDTLVDISNIQFEAQTADAVLVSFRFMEQQFHVLALYRFGFLPINLFNNEFEKKFMNKDKDFKKFSNLFWIGDLNINLLDSSCNDIDSYKTMLASNGLECLISEPTRVTEQSVTCIDHVYARVKDRSRVDVEPAVIDANISDHSMIRVVVSVEGTNGDGSGDGGTGQVPAAPPPRWRTDYTKLRQLLADADWTAVYKATDASVAFENFF